MVEAHIRPQGPYSLKLTTWTSEWRARAPRRTLGRGATAAGRGRAPAGLVRTARSRRARFMLALDDDTTEFHRRFRAGPDSRRDRTQAARPATTPEGNGRSRDAPCDLRPAHPVEPGTPDRAGRDPRLRRVRTEPRGARAPLARRALAGCGLAQSRATTLGRLVRTLDLEALKTAPETALAPLAARARHRPLECRRHRAARPRTLRRRSRRRPRPREARCRANRSLAGSGGDDRSCSTPTASGRGLRASTCSRASSEDWFHTLTPIAPGSQGASRNTPADGSS